MKHLLISLMTLLSLSIYGQDKIYVHTATTANITGNFTTIDHPDLNGNPNAGIVFSHVWNPNGSTGVYNNHIDGLWYDNNHWHIFNEDLSNMVVGAKFFIYIASNSSDVITHVSDASNQGALISNTEINYASLNNYNPGPYAVMSNYWNSHQVYNPYNYGFLYNTTTNRRVIYNESLDAIPNNAAFRILVKGFSGPNFTTHTANASNILANFTIIDHPQLNNNPDAAFVFSHYWGVDGTATTRVVVNHKISAFYSTSLHKWGLLIEDPSATFPEGAAFDIIIAPQDTTSAVDEVSVNQKIGIYPNPVKDVLKITTQKNIKTIRIFNTLGQELKNVSVSGDTDLLQIPVHQLPEGTYILKVEYQDGNTGTVKFIK